MLTRSFPRFLIQAALLIVVAAIAAAIHLGPLTIVLVVAAAFGIVVGTEWLATRESKPQRRRTPDPTRPQPAPRLGLPEAERVDRSRSAPVPAPPPPIVQRRWNVFELENRARTIAGKDAARDEDISFLLLYLREFADDDGDLNEDFDTFIRESFPDLLQVAALPPPEGE